MNGVKYSPEEIAVKIERVRRNAKIVAKLEAGETMASVAREFKLSLKVVDNMLAVHQKLLRRGQPGYVKSADKWIADLEANRGQQLAELSQQKRITKRLRWHRERIEEIVDSIRR